jgi:ABC-type nitrate/sulfonate/bicarbonate transport system permease component
MILLKKFTEGCDFVQNRRTRLLNLASILAVLLLWQIISLFVPPLYLPGPVKVVVDSYALYKDILAESIIATLSRVIAGFFLGSLLGVVVATAMSWNKTILALLEPIVEVIRPVPVLALTPLFILWFGLGETGKVLLIATGAFVTLVVNTREAIRNVKPVYIEAAQTLGASTKRDIFRTVILRAITPEVVAGFRVAAASSFGLAAAAEFLGAQTGVGYIIIQARRFLYTHGVIFGILILSVFSMIADVLVRKLDRKVNNWTQRSS